jgi:hypothetical protein
VSFNVTGQLITYSALCRYLIKRKYNPAVPELWIYFMKAYELVAWDVCIIFSLSLVFHKINIGQLKCV